MIYILISNMYRSLIYKLSSRTASVTGDRYPGGELGWGGEEDIPGAGDLAWLIVVAVLRGTQFGSHNPN